MISPPKSVPFGRRAAAPNNANADDGRRGELSREWDYDEGSSWLGNRALDAELKLELPRASDDPAIAVPARFRQGGIELMLRFHRRLDIHGTSHMKLPPTRVTWWAANYAEAKTTATANGAANRLAEDVWRRLDDVLFEAMCTFLFIKPRHAAGVEALHLEGGYLGREWLSRSFRSFGAGTWFPITDERKHATRIEMVHRTPLPASGWRFVDNGAPRIVHEPSGEMLICDAGPPKTPKPFQQRHCAFRYQGRFGSFELPSAVHDIYVLSELVPPVSWEVDFSRSVGIRAGESRGWVQGSIRPAKQGEARLSELDFLDFRRTVTEGLLNWPACELTGPAPLWITTRGGYHEGGWDSLLPHTVGPNAAVTGLLCGSRT